MKYVLSVLVIFCSLILHAQDRDIRLYEGSQKDSVIIENDTLVKKQFDLNFQEKDGQINVYGDSRLDKLNEFNATPQSGQSGVKMQGYRLQIFYDQEKNNINQKKADYLARYKDQPAYVNYKAPNFRLRVGDFRTRLQAEKYMNEIRVDWPDAIIVEDDIDLPSYE